MEEGVSLNISSKSRGQEGASVKCTMHEIKDRTSQLLKACTVMSAGQPLPDTYEISLRVYYTEGRYIFIWICSVSMVMGHIEMNEWMYDTTTNNFYCGGGYQLFVLVHMNMNFLHGTAVWFIAASVVLIYFKIHTITSWSSVGQSMARQQSF